MCQWHFVIRITKLVIGGLVVRRAWEHSVKHPGVSNIATVPLSAFGEQSAQRGGLVSMYASLQIGAYVAPLAEKHAWHASHQLIECK